MDPAIEQYFKSIRATLNPTHPEDDDWMLWEDDPFDDFLDDMGAARTSPKKFVDIIPQGLDSPLLSTHRIKLIAALEGRKEDYRLRSTVSLKKEEAFIKRIRVLCPEKQLVVLSTEGSAELISEAWEKGRHQPRSLKKSKTVERIISARRAQFRDSPIDWTLLRSAPVRDAAGAALPYQFAQNARRRVSDSSSGVEIVSSDLFDSKVHIGLNYVAWEYSRVVKLASFDTFLCVHDALIRRMKLTVADIILGVSESIGCTPLAETATRVGHWQLRLILSGGDKCYDVAKAPEALYKTWASDLAGGSPGTPTPYDRMLEKYREKLRDLDVSEDFIDEIDTIVRACEFYEEAVELSPMIRLAGHPVIDPTTSAAKSRRLATADDNSSPRKIEVSCYLFSHLMCKEYLRQNGRWPPIEFAPGSNTRLEYLRKNGWMALSDDDYPLDDWYHAEMQQIEEFDYHENYLHLFKDKSCSPGKARLEEFYHQPRGLDRDFRRLLLQMMNQPMIDTKQLIVEWANDSLTDDDHLILLYPKECEFKKQGRMFCMLTLKARLAFSIIQENVKSSIMKYLPFTSMVMGHAQLRSTLLELSANRGNQRTLFLELDLSSWNLMFRNFWIKELGELMDTMLGVREVFGRSHEFFAFSEVVVLAGDSRIDQLEDGTRGQRSTDNMWYDHRGGFEGIDQATWTVATILMVYTALLGTNCSFMLLGQGDNQTIAITRPMDDPVSDSDFVKMITKRIERTCGKFNHIAKPEEFIESTRQITYSKDYYLNGVHVPKELHLASQAGPRTTDDVPTIAASMGAIFSSHITSASNARKPGRHFDLAVWEAGTFLEDVQKGVGPYSPLDMKLTPELLELSLLCPSSLGGMPVSPLSSFLTSGEPDILVSSIASIRVLGLPISLQYLRALGDGMIMETTPSISVLLEDPFALPLISTKRATSIYESITEARVKQAYNIDIGPVVSFYGEGKKPITDFLSNITPFAPTILSDLMTLSSYGAAVKIKKMFTLTRTLVSSAQSRGDIEMKVRLAGRSESMGALMRFSIVTRQSSPRRTDVTDSSLQLAKKMRSYWKKEIVGLEVTHPFDILPSRCIDGDQGVEVTVSNTILDLSVRGPHKPYLGGLTKEHRIGKDFSVVEGPVTDDLKKLAIIASSADYQEEIRMFMNSVCLSRCDHELDTMRLVLPTIDGGALAHRYRELGSKGAVRPLGNLRIAEHIAFTTDYIDGLSGSVVDYPVVFQMYFCTAIEWARSFREIEVETGATRRFTIPLRVKSIPPLVEPEFRLEKDVPIPGLLAQKGNPLIYIDDLKILKEGSFSRTVNVDFPSTPDLRAITGTLLSILLRKRVMTTALEEASDRLRIESLDEALFYSVGSEVLYQACVSAGAHILAYKYMLTGSNEMIRYRPMALAIRIAQWISPLIASGIRREALRVPGGWAEYVSLIAPGQHGDVNYIKRLETDIANDVVNLSMSRTFTDETLDLWVPSKGETITEADAASLEVSRLLWAISARTPHASVGVMRQEFMKFREIMRRSHESAILLLGLYQYSVRIRLLLTSFQDTLGPEGPALVALTGRGISGINISPEESLRRCRLWNAEKPAARVAPSERYHPGDNCKLKVRQEDSFMTSMSLLDPVPVEDRCRLKDKLTRRRRISYSPFSTVASMWACVIKRHEVRGRVLVLGTGAGGIQRLMSGYGITSEGLDIQSSVPISVQTLGRGSPPDCHGRENAVYNVATFSTSGDCCDQGVLTNAVIDRFQTFIIDVEVNSQTPCISVLKALQASGATGLVYMKVLTSLDQVLLYYSRLQEAGSSPSLYQLGTWNVKVGSGPFVLRFDMRASATLFSSTFRVARLDDSYIEPKQVGHPIRKQYLPEYLHAISHGLLGRSENVFEALHTVIETLDDIRGEYRGEIHGTEIMDRAEWVSFLAWTLARFDDVDISDDMIFKEVETMYDTGGYVNTVSRKNLRDIQVDIDRPGMIYLFQTVLPRLVEHKALWPDLHPLPL
uniref:RNA-directed RNA polymerase n=1 Tax=Rhizoctonia cerealis phyllomonavirus TaxID=3068671 RepID=A0AA51BSU5_9MONO|nr:MAG: RNA-dependent RNA polymerase [Rhizoctonia cerealis phyllomonavirus]